MDATYDLGLARCVYGFATGVLCNLAYQRIRRTREVRRTTGLEIVTISLALAFVMGASDWSAVTILAPVAFAPAVLTLAFESGRISHWLANARLQTLGTLSYSIYMVHGLIKDLADAVVVFAQHLTGITLSTMSDIPGIGTVRTIGVGPWSTAASTMGLLLLTVGVSHLTYRWIEQPFRELSRRYRRREPAMAEAQAVTVFTAG